MNCLKYFSDEVLQVKEVNVELSNLLLSVSLFNDRRLSTEGVGPNRNVSSSVHDVRSNNKSLFLHRTSEKEVDRIIKE